MTFLHQKGVSGSDALFPFWAQLSLRTIAVLLLWFLVAPPEALALRCIPDAPERTARVVRVYDGDTIGLASGERVRLIGVNTPELGRDDTLPQALAGEARDQLRALLAEHGNRVGLHPGRERRDRYGRLLAHITLADGRSLAAWLLEQGLGFVIAIPPNLVNLDCYLASERQARDQRRGVWSLPEYVAANTRSLPGSARGFQRIRGRVERVRSSRNSVWINLQGGVALRVDRKDLGYFNLARIRGLRGQIVTARGWLYRHKDRLRMRIRHPAMLESVQ